MFNFIGIIVVVATLVIGYSSFQKWYEGSATPSETVVNLRDQFSAAIKSKSDEKSELANSSQDDAHSKVEDTESDTSDFSTEKAARELIKDFHE